MNFDVYQLLTLGIFVLIVAAVAAVGIGLYVSARRERTEREAAEQLQAPAVVATEDTGYFADVSSTNAIIVDAAQENTSRSGGTYRPTEREDPFDL